MDTRNCTRTKIRFNQTGEYYEVVQFGVIILELEPNLTEVSSFEVLTRPEFNPVLSASKGQSTPRHVQLS